MRPEVLVSAFQSIQELNQLVELPQLASTAPFSSLQKLDMILVAAIDHLQPILLPEMAFTQSKKQDLQSSIEKLADDIQKKESTLESKKKQLFRLESELKSLIAQEENENSVHNMNKTLEKTKVHLINQIIGSSDTSLTAESPSNRCQISYNGLIGINSAFEKCLQSAESVADLNESSCWTLFKEIGISEEKMERMETRLFQSQQRKEDSLKSMMEELADTFSVDQIIEELEGIIDVEEASRLVLSLRLISRGLKMVRLPHWIVKDENKSNECQQIIQWMESGGIFSKDPEAKDKIIRHLSKNESVSTTQLLMRIDEMVSQFPLKATFLIINQTLACGMESNAS